MKKLNFPVIKTSLPGPKVLTMDEYFKFVTFNLKYTTDKKRRKALTGKLPVNTPFRLK